MTQTKTQAKMPATRSTPPRQSWTVVLFGFIALSLAFSARAALGLIMPVWQAEFGWSSRFISGVGAAALIVMAVVAPFAGRLVDRKGPRFALNLGLGLLGLGCALVAAMTGKAMFLLGFAGLAALGFGIVATHVVATAVARAFTSRVGLATGVATSGATGGQFLILPLIAGLLSFASWRWSFAAIALACLVLIPSLRLSLKETVGSEAVERTEGPGLTGDLGTLLRRPASHLLFWSFLICGFTTTGVIETHLLPFAAFCGFGPVPSAGAYGLLSAVNLIGMIAAGWLSDRVNRVLLLAGIYLLRALAFLLLVHMPGSSIETLFLFGLLFGAVDYATVPVTASLVASHVGLRRMGLAMGMISAGHALGGALGAYLGGYVFDTTMGYRLLWIGSLWLAVVAGVIVLFIGKAPAENDSVVQRRSCE